MKAIRIHSYGGPEVLKYEDAPVPQPGPCEALVEVHVSGVNFVDTYYRAGLYKAGGLPFVPGSEAAGVVAAVGQGVTDLHAGDRVARANEPYSRDGCADGWYPVRPAGFVCASGGATVDLSHPTLAARPFAKR